ncbi:MAG TPA: helix-turn-helix domain-containing protein [Vicinamibacterales bacterium]|nr:helix-turn-helix domain-containing protein [Vicinamibacterales bacterium]
MNKLLDQLVTEMVARGVHYEDARREFDKRFIAKVIDNADGNLCRAAETLGVHRNTLARKIAELKIKAG